MIELLASNGISERESLWVAIVSGATILVVLCIGIYLDLRGGK